MNFMTLQQLADILEGKLVCSSAEPAWATTYSDNSIDTRTLQRGDLFWALPGTQADGHDFVPQAFLSGASAAVVSRLEPSSPGGPVVLVPDVAAALARLASWHRKYQDALLIGVTGSVGKTTTREMLHQVLAQRFSGMQSPANYNNRLGVPLSLLRLESEHEYGVLELAASATGEIAALSQLVAPEVGVITHIAPAHLDGFGTLDQIANTKAELFAALPATGFAVIPEEFASQPAVRRTVSCRLLKTGLGNDCDIQAHGVSQSEGILRFIVDRQHYALNVPGRHFLSSALICLAIAREFGMTPTEVQAGFQKFRPLPGRGRVLRIGHWTVVDDTYNASPVAVQAGLRMLTGLPVPGPRIAVLGDMLCLGDQTAYHHRRIGRDISRAGVDYLVTFGQAAHDYASGALQGGMSASRIAVFQDLEQLQHILGLWLTPGAALLLKGSRKMQLDRLIPWLERESTQVATLQTPAFLKRAG